MQTRLLLVSTVALFTAACGCDSCDTEQSVGVAPVGAVAVTPSFPGLEAEPGSPKAIVADVVKALHAHKVSDVIRLSASSDEFAAMKTAWDEKRAAGMSEREAAEFAAQMEMITAEGAEEQLFQMLQPNLAEAQQQMQMLAGMAPMMAAGALEDSGAPPEAAQVVMGIAQKLGTLDVGNEDKAKRAIAIVCDAARSLELKTSDDVLALEFDEVLGKADVAYGALIDVLGVYDVDVDGVLESIALETIEVDGDSATLSMSMTMFGATLQDLPLEMERVDGRWMPKREEPTEAVDAAPMTESDLAR